LSRLPTSTKCHAAHAPHTHSQLGSDTQCTRQVLYGIHKPWTLLRGRFWDLRIKQICDVMMLPDYHELADHFEVMAYEMYSRVYNINPHILQHSTANLIYNKA
jgi:hypothetical protein